MGTVTLSAAAPTGGAVVSLSSSNTDVARVSSSVSIAAGSTSNTVNIDVTTVGVSTSVTITATYSGVSKTGSFTVTPPPLEARFTVVSRRHGANACGIDDSDGHMDCEFDGRSSTGSIKEFQWKLRIDNDTYEVKSADGLTHLSPNCGFLDGGGTQTDGDYVNMGVELNVVGRDGERSTAASRTIKLYPHKNCDYP